MRILISAFNHLLADVSRVSRVPLGAPYDTEIYWILKEGPALDKAILAYLEYGLEKPTIPDWLLPLWDAFLVSDNGRLLGLLRQVCLFGYKTEIEPSNAQIAEATRQFVDTDEDVGTFEEAFASLKGYPLFSSARRIVGRVIHKINWSEIIPSHGPGAVYPPRDPSEKSDFRTIYKTIEPKYPYYGYFNQLPQTWYEERINSKWIQHEQNNICCKLTMVPKDSRGPRTICVHPAEAIWIQQGQRRLLESAIERCSLTRDRISFRDQRVNGNLARKASETREYFTLDLREASDRVSCSLVRHLFGDYAYDWISAARASYVDIPRGLLPAGYLERGVQSEVSSDSISIALRKWAPMGNCLTFPVESLIFYALARSGILSRHGVNCDEVYVFGDDIIAPSKYYEGVLYGLTLGGLVPNIGKTFRHGFFRESCGVDAYRGIDVTPLRIRNVAIDTNSGALSLCDLAKRLRLKGFESCASYIYQQLRRRFGRSMCYSNNLDAQGVYEYVDTRSVLLYEPSLRYNSELQRWQTRCLLAKGGYFTTKSGDWNLLQDSLTRLALMGSAISKRGLEYAVPHRERLVRGWTVFNFTTSV